MPDRAGLLPPAALARLESQLADFERETTHQSAVLTVPSLQGEPIEAFALRVAERAELGQRGLDNGILLVVAAEDRRARVEVGYGLEGVVPDAVAKRVLEDAIFPRFRAGDLAGGIEAGVLALASAARGEGVPADRRPGSPAARTGGGAEALAAVVFGAIFSSLLWLPLRRRRARGLHAFLSGATSGVLSWLLVTSLAWAAIGAGLGLLLAWLGLGRDVLFLPSRRGRGWSGGGWGSSGSGGGTGGFGGGGFSGGGGGFGGGGASGGW